MFPNNRPSDARPFDFARRAVVLTTLFGAGMALSSPTLAQTSRTQASDAPAMVVSTRIQAQSPLTLQAPVIDTSSDSLFSSSAAESAPTTEASLVPPVNFANAMQYGGGQRRYGRPRYRGGNTNQDGSSKYTFFAGAGLSQPIGNTWHYLTPSYGFQIGGGRNFSRNVGLMAQFDYDHFGFTGQTLTNQSFVYNTVFGAGSVSGLDGSSHVWSFTLDPIYNIYSGSGEGLGAYVVAGAGFYHKTANFTEPAAGLCYDVYYGYYQCTANQTIDKYTSNAAGFNGGLGLTYKFSRFSNERFYLEARYVFVADSQRHGITAKTAAPTAAEQAATDFYPANSNRTTYIPIKVGLRF